MLLGHKELKEEGADLETLPCRLREQVFLLKAELGHPRSGWDGDGGRVEGWGVEGWGVGSGAARGTKPPWESRGSARMQSAGLPRLEAEYCSSHTARDLRQISEDTGPFVVSVFGFSHARGQLSPILHGLMRRCV